MFFIIDYCLKKDNNKNKKDIKYKIVFNKIKKKRKEWMNYW